MDWSPLYPDYVAQVPCSPNERAVGEIQPPAKLTRHVEVADVGCGFGGLLVALAPLMPGTLILGKKDYTRKQWLAYPANHIQALRYASP